MMNITLPSFPEGDTIDAKTVREIKEYIYQLHELVRYMFSHVDAENLTDELRAKIEEGGESAAVTQKLEDLDGNVLAVSKTAKGLAVKVESAEGKASEAKQTADGVNVKVENLAGQVSSLDITASGIMAAVNNNRLSFSASGLALRNSSGQTVFAQDTSGNLSVTGYISATGGYIGNLEITPYGLRYGNMEIYVGGSYPEIRIGGLTISGNPSQGMIYGDVEAPIFAVNYNGVYVGRWQS